ncbi:GNAT family N-acetyltransferase [Candidatus Woesearchaeota archaeon]|jgi:N-acetylglutamate synthase-like GNAT family acetyltransferase|nr:GNAT family N-acetyltransferase [Candidatus Woesearchaeota archaeon]MBT7402447.1 GNAT family N-acetyltransferase [Candidatus Woesearchaeota archaeon]
MKIRKAKTSDLSEIQAISKKYKFEPDRDWSGLIQDKDKEFFVVVEDNNIIGFTGLIHFNWNNTLQISNIFILPNYRKKGIGLQLVNYLLDKAKKTKYRCLIAEAPSTSLVVKLYKKAGFRKCGYNDRYYYNNTKIIAYWMSYDLK